MSNPELQVLPDPEITPKVIVKEMHIISMLLQTIDTITYEISRTGSDWYNPDYFA